jgi:RNA polymerase sigma-70 factor, ECF subfamily
VGVGLDDAKLVAQVIAGETLAFERLYRRYAGFAFNLAVRLQGSTVDAEDLVHDAFLKAHQRLSSLRDPSLFKSWLGSILVSLLRTRMRRRRMLKGLGVGSGDPVELDSVASSGASPEVTAELAQLYALLRLVAADERIAWTLRNVERHRLEDVATLTSCSLATAKRRIARAQRFLDEHFVAARSEQRADIAAPPVKAQDSSP